MANLTGTFRLRSSGNGDITETSKSFSDVVGADAASFNQTFTPGSWDSLDIPASITNFGWIEIISLDADNFLKIAHNNSGAPLQFGKVPTQTAAAFHQDDDNMAITDLRFRADTADIRVKVTVYEVP